MSVTLRPRFLLGLLALWVIGTIVALASGAGRFALVGVGLVSITGFACRQSLRVDDRGVRYRSLVPTEDFALPWSEVGQVVVEIVNPSSPGAPSSPVARATFVPPSGPARSAMLFSRADGERLLAVCRARNVPVLDSRAAD